MLNWFQSVIDYFFDIYSDESIALRDPYFLKNSVVVQHTFYVIEQFLSLKNVNISFKEGR